MKLWLSLLLAVLVPLTLLAETTEKTPKDKKATPPAASAGDKENAILEGIPAEQTYYGLRIPNFSPSGKLLMLLDAKAAKRLNERNIEMKDLRIEIHNEDNTTFVVSMPHSVFNLDTRILTSDTATKISREDFTIEGERAEFHTHKKFGRMLGATKMIILTTDNIQ